MINKLTLSQWTEELYIQGDLKRFNSLMGAFFHIILKSLHTFTIPVTYSLNRRKVFKYINISCQYLN